MSKSPWKLIASSLGLSIANDKTLTSCTISVSEVDGHWSLYFLAPGENKKYIHVSPGHTAKREMGKMKALPIEVTWSIVKSSTQSNSFYFAFPEKFTITIGDLKTIIKGIYPSSIPRLQDPAGCNSWCLQVIDSIIEAYQGNRKVEEYSKDDSSKRFEDAKNWILKFTSQNQTLLSHYASNPIAKEYLIDY